jgi:hypothetical protein
MAAPWHIHTDMTRTECRDRCLRDPHCVAFQYDPHQYTCALHRDATAVLPDALAPDACCSVWRKTLCYGTTCCTSAGGSLIVGCWMNR